MNENSIVVDGHATTGKSTIAQRLAMHFNYAYTKPFDDKIGEINKFLFEKNDGRLESFRSSVIDFYTTSSDTPRVFDRLGPSTLSLLPEERWPEQLANSRRTIILWCDPETTTLRLRERSRDIWSPSQHTDFINKFRRIADRYGVLLIDTARLDVADTLTTIINHLTTQDRTRANDC